MRFLINRCYTTNDFWPDKPTLPCTPRHLSAWTTRLIAAALIMGLASYAHAARDRAYIDNVTVRSDQGTLLRGPFIKLWNRTIYPINSDSPEVYAPAYWQAYKDAGYNSVRIAVAWGTRSYQDFSPDTTLQALDELVSTLTSLGMHVTICGSAHDYAYYYADDLQDAWNHIAPRYANNRNVLYEIQNEPMGDPNGFHSNPPPPKGNANELVKTYQSVRAKAPDTIIGMWGFSALGDSTNDAVWVTKKYDPNKTISYTKTAVAFHYYPPTESAYVNKLKRIYPVWMTEGSDEGPGAYLDRDLSWYADSEAKGISWYFMDFQDTLEKGKHIANYLTGKGYGWLPDTAKKPTRGLLYEVEGLSTTNSGQTPPNTLTSEQASGGEAVVFPSTGNDQWVEFTLPKVQAGTYRVRAHILRHPSFGIFRMSIGGQDVGNTVNEYANTSLLSEYEQSTRSTGDTANVSESSLFTTVDVGTVSFASSGNKTVRFTVSGKHSASTGHTLAIDAIELIQ